jgi:hypothetical protein
MHQQFLPVAGACGLEQFGVTPRRLAQRPDDGVADCCGCNLNVVEAIET